jgi:hypothetical protein
MGAGLSVVSAFLFTTAALSLVSDLLLLLRGFRSRRLLSRNPLAPVRPEASHRPVYRSVALQDHCPWVAPGASPGNFGLQSSTLRVLAISDHKLIGCMYLIFGFFAAPVGRNLWSLTLQRHCFLPGFALTKASAPFGLLEVFLGFFDQHFQGNFRG